MAAVLHRPLLLLLLRDLGALTVEGEVLAAGVDPLAAVPQAAAAPLVVLTIRMTTLGRTTTPVRDTILRGITSG